MRCGTDNVEEPSDGLGLMSRGFITSVLGCSSPRDVILDVQYVARVRLDGMDPESMEEMEGRIGSSTSQERNGGRIGRGKNERDVNGEFGVLFGDTSTLHGRGDDVIFSC